MARFKVGDKVKIRDDARAMGAHPDKIGGGPLSTYAGAHGVVSRVLKSNGYDYDVNIEGRGGDASFFGYELLVDDS